MKKLLFATLIAGSLLNVSCKKDADDAPVLPDAETMEMNFSDFNNNNSSNANRRTTVDTNKIDHWLRAALQVGYWNVILTTNIAIPVLSYKEAFNHTPEYVNKEEGWLWEYTVSNNTGTYTCKLYGKFNDNKQTEWKMLISKAGAYTDVQWYSGTSNNDKSGGSWSLNKNAYNATNYLDVDWTKSGSKKEIKYTAVEAGTDGYGSYIEYGVDTALTMDAHYNIHLAKDNHDVNIMWNRTTKEGKVKEPKHYLDDEYRCWNAQLKNSVCN